jgi:integrase
MKLKEARDMADDIYKGIQRGDYPHDQRDKRNAAQKDSKDAHEALGNVETLFDEYIALLTAEGKRSATEVQTMYNCDIHPVIGEMKAQDVKPTDIRGVLHPVIERGAMVKANRVRSFLQAAFTFGIHWDNDSGNYKRSLRFKIEYNPVRDVPRPLKNEKPGTRYLNEEELRTIWPLLGAVKMGKEMGMALRLMLATGQRVEECLQAEWSEFDDAHWIIPNNRTKNGLTHVVPLNQIAKDVLASLNKDGTYLFANPSTKKPMRTDSISTATKRFCVDTGTKHFTPRDLRRTVKTLMGKAGIPKEHRDRVQNHSLSDVSSRHYDHYDYLSEKESAIRNWGQYLRNTLDGKKNTVVEFPKRGTQ